MRMIYKLLGMTIPKELRNKLSEKGVEFSEYFPVKENSIPPHETIKSTLGLIKQRS